MFKGKTLVGAAEELKCDMQKAQVLLVVLDASASNATFRLGKSKLQLGNETVALLNQTIRPLELTSGLRVVDNDTRLIYGMTKHSVENFDTALATVKQAAGNIPISKAIDAAREDLKVVNGNIAMIVVSDGMTADNATIASVGRLKEEFGKRLCLYTILTGNDPKGSKLMAQMPQSSACGFATQANTLNSPAAMLDFVQKVFFLSKDELMDSDGDGIRNDMDQCPDTPKGIEVDTQGCPPDTDGDGVYDFKDECVRTPKGAKVDEKGCWLIHRVHFDFNKADIKAQYLPALNEAVVVFKNSKDLKAEIQGHADDVGSDAYNQALSEKRANAVMNYLIRKGVNKAQISVKGFGLTKPLIPNDNDEHRALNRRAETIIMP
jgi:OOP family OmpA-OmpF porin